MGSADEQNGIFDFSYQLRIVPPGELLEDVDGGTWPAALVDRKHGLSDGDKQAVFGIGVEICCFGADKAGTLHIHGSTPVHAEECCGVGG